MTEVAGTRGQQSTCSSSPSLQNMEIKTAKLNVKNFYRSLTTVVRAQTLNRHKTANQLIPCSFNKKVIII